MSLALGGVFWVALVGAVLGFLATLVMRELPLRGSHRQAGEAAPQVRDEEPEMVSVS
jgi:hypothetical protein